MWKKWKVRRARFNGSLSLFFCCVCLIKNEPQWLQMIANCGRLPIATTPILYRKSEKKISVWIITKLSNLSPWTLMGCVRKWCLFVLYNYDILLLNNITTAQLYPQEMCCYFIIFLKVNYLLTWRSSFF